MSVRRYQQLLREARSELEAYIRMTGGNKTTQKTLDFLKHTHTRMVGQLETALALSEEKLEWRSPEAGAWRTEKNGYEINIYKDGGVYYWTVGCTDSKACDTLEDAKREVSVMVGAA